MKESEKHFGEDGPHHGPQMPMQGPAIPSGDAVARLKGHVHDELSKLNPIERMSQGNGSPAMKAHKAAEDAERVRRTAYGKYRDR